MMVEIYGGTGGSSGFFNQKVTVGSKQSANISSTFKTQINANMNALFSPVEYGLELSVGYEISSSFTSEISHVREFSIRIDMSKPCYHGDDQIYRILICNITQIVPKV